MRPLLHLALPVLLFAGCSAQRDQPAAGVPAEQPAEVTQQPVPPPPPPPPPLSPAAGDADRGAAKLGSSQEQPPSEPAAPGQQCAIKLSAGVALPQTTLEGTMMSFSVDYQFTAGQPDPSTPYAWVIERAKGPPARLEVRLDDKGTLQGLAPGWLPRDGPFQTHLEDRSGNRLSSSVPLQ